MIVDYDPREVIHRLGRWAGHRDAIRAVLLTSTRAKPDTPVDVLSDYDVVLVVEEIRPFFDDRSWLEAFGEVLVAYWDPVYPDPDHGVDQTGNVVQYADGLHIDFRLWPPWRVGSRGTRGSRPSWTTGTPCSWTRTASSRA